MLRNQNRLLQNQLSGSPQSKIASTNLHDDSKQGWGHPQSNINNTDILDDDTQESWDSDENDDSPTSPHYSVPENLTNISQGGEYADIKTAVSLLGPMDLRATRRTHSSDASRETMGGATGRLSHNSDASKATLEGSAGRLSNNSNATRITLDTTESLQTTGEYTAHTSDGEHIQAVTITDNGIIKDKYGIKSCDDEDSQSEWRDQYNASQSKMRLENEAEERRGLEIEYIGSDEESEEEETESEEDEEETEEEEEHGKENDRNESKDEDTSFDIDEMDATSSPKRSGHVTKALKLAETGYLTNVKLDANQR